jgi:hypothetical protein
MAPPNRRRLWHRECGDIFRHWLIAVVAIAVVTAAGGALISPGDSAANRMAAAAFGAILGLALVAVGVVVIALIRMPLSVYRERHRLKLLGQECCDVVDEMLRSARFEKDSWGHVVFAESDPSSLAHYNTKLAARVYAGARELEKRDVIDRGQREKLAEPPNEVSGYIDIFHLLEPSAG